MRRVLCFAVCLCALTLGAQDNDNPKAEKGKEPGTGSLLSTLDDKHRLRPGDVVSFRIIEDREQPKKLSVADSGELDVPYIGRVNVTEKTCKQAALEIKGMLEQDFYHQATVMIGLDSMSPVGSRIYIWGQVRRQGPIDIPRGEIFTAGKAILIAGGFGDFANKKKVKVIRKPDGGPVENESHELDMVEILERGKTHLDMQLQPDDLILVPPKLINF